MTAAELAKIVDANPMLTSFGFGTYFNPSQTPAQRKAEFEKEREELRKSAEACTKAEDWLRDKATVKSVDRTRTSYGLKHEAENEIGYVTNGQFIAAAISLGLKVVPIGPNAFFNLSRKALRSVPTKLHAT